LAVPPTTAVIRHSQISIDFENADPFSSAVPFRERPQRRATSANAICLPNGGRATFPPRAPALQRTYWLQSVLLHWRLTWDSTAAGSRADPMEWLRRVHPARLNRRATTGWQPGWNHQSALITVRTTNVRTQSFGQFGKMRSLPHASTDKPNWIGCLIPRKPFDAKSLSGPPFCFSPNPAILKYYQFRKR
jgi:hypothetical protein